MTRIELWYEDGEPELMIHVNEKLSFDEARRQLTAMRDRLTQEIENGPKYCPFVNHQGEARKAILGVM